MKVSMDIELKDVPGQLVSALIPISELGGNIISVLHHRDRKTQRGTIPVQVVFDVEESKLAALLQRLRERGITVVRVGAERLKEAVFVLLIGHIVRSGVKELINEVDGTGVAEVVELFLSMPAVEEKSAAALKIRAIGKMELERALDIVEGFAARCGILVVRPIEDEL
ncbi:amino acid-binding protein [Candidatus Alkanophaga liquidiphilum]|nr:ACT domain protein [Candidatus Alkanophaga liquidiphilum]RLG38946.1 MAG: amino acid-binding protein [Candidatus Alkanophagales archaeon]